MSVLNSRFSLHFIYQKILHLCHKDLEIQVETQQEKEQHLFPFNTSDHRKRFQSYFTERHTHTDSASF